MRRKVITISLIIAFYLFLYYNIEKKSKLFLENSHPVVGITEGYIGNNIKYIYRVKDKKYEGSVRENFYEVVIKNGAYVVAYLPDNPEKSQMLLHRPIDTSRLDAVDTIKFSKDDFSFLTYLGLSKVE